MTTTTIKKRQKEEIEEEEQQKNVHKETVNSEEDNYTSLGKYLIIDLNTTKTKMDNLKEKKDLFLGNFHPFTTATTEDDDGNVDNDNNAAKDTLLNSISPSEVVNECSDDTGISIPTEKKIMFDEAWRELLIKTFYNKSNNKINGNCCKKELDDYLCTGTSNGYQLGLQVMILPPGTYFPIHCHPNIEFEYTMLGALREFRWLDLIIPKDIICNDNNNIKNNSDKKKDSRESDCNTVMKIASTSMFVEKTVKQNQCMLNEVGSVHQSFTDNQGCMILVLWSKVHKKIHPSCCFNADPRLRPNIGW